MLQPLNFLKPQNIVVCVTGANGYIASEVVRQLLERGYLVNGVVRDKNDEAKVGHLKKFHNAAKNLKLFNANLLEQKGYEDPISGSQIVLHMASPLFAGSNEDDFVKPAVEGTLNVLKTVESHGKDVRCVVLTSSIAAISSNGGLLPETHVFTEADWSPIDRLRELKRYYPLSKTLAEKAAWDYPLVKSGKLKLVSICPGYVIGPITSKNHVSGTAKGWLDALSGAWETIPNKESVPVYVKDVARAHIRAFEDPESEGRYALVAPGPVHFKDIADALHRVDPKCKVPTTVDTGKLSKMDLWNTRKAEKLIGGFSSWEEFAIATLASYKELELI